MKGLIILSTIYFVQLSSVQGDDGVYNEASVFFNKEDSKWNETIKSFTDKAMIKQTMKQIEALDDTLSSAVKSLDDPTKLENFNKTIVKLIDQLKSSEDKFDNFLTTYWNRIHDFLLTSLDRYFRVKHLPKLRECWDKYRTEILSIIGGFMGKICDSVLSETEAVSEIEATFHNKIGEANQNFSSGVTNCESDGSPKICTAERVSIC